MSVVSPRLPPLRDGPIEGVRPALGANLVVVAMTLAAFGPYVMGSIRTEQLIVYSLAPLLIFFSVRLRLWAFGILTTWMMALVLVTVGHIFRYSGFAPWPSGSALAGYDNLLLPLVVMMLIWALVPATGAGSTLRLASRLIVVLASLNALLAIVSSIVPSMSSFLQNFWVGGSGESSVAERAMTMGRISGIFNQPAEAGLVYSVALVLTVFVFSKRPVFMYFFMGLITIGGFLSVSKIFILVGLPSSVILLFIIQRLSGRITVFLAAGLFLVFLGTASFFQEWTGLSYLTRLLDVPESQTVLQFYTAGRWSEDSAVVTVMSYILGASPLIGMGVAGLTVPYDSLWTEAIVTGGILMAVTMAGVLFLLLKAFRRIASRDVRFTAYAVWVILMGASFGIPSLTVNRGATIVWVVAALLVAISGRSLNRVQEACFHKRGL